MTKYYCSHRKSWTGGEYALTRTVCEGNDEEGHFKIEICDHCKTVIITIVSRQGHTRTIQIED